MGSFWASFYLQSVGGAHMEPQGLCHGFLEEDKREVTTMEEITDIKEELVVVIDWADS
uniref:Uncharacterized protein n=1 Tax=Arion vulgaris TaxID=1028688 RepID=A0A0B7AGC4_9EUPU